MAGYYELITTAGPSAPPLVLQHGQATHPARCHNAGFIDGRAGQFSERNGFRMHPIIAWTSPPLLKNKPTKRMVKAADRRGEHRAAQIPQQLDLRRLQRVQPRQPYFYYFTTTGTSPAATFDPWPNRCRSSASFLPSPFPEPLT